MGDLAKVKRQFTLILVVLGLVGLVLIGYLIWPGSSKASKLAQEQALQQQATSLAHEVAPLDGLSDKLDKTRVDVKKFYEQKVPSQSSEISQHLEKLVQEAGVTTLGFRYSQERSNTEKDELPGVRRIGIETTVSGEYSKVAGFINALERDRLVFVINQIALSGSEGGGVSLQIKFETFLRET
jgi:Tfp pilus assembly protein PilO